MELRIIEKSQELYVVREGEEDAGVFEWLCDLGTELFVTEDGYAFRMEQARILAEVDVPRMGRKHVMCQAYRFKLDSPVHIAGAAMKALRRDLDRVFSTGEKNARMKVQGI
jgi:hypothetical protein